MGDIFEDAAALGQLNQDQKTLLDTIDSLRALGVGKIVDLPQIIVVGDQSSGKSSVLEAISRARFPVKGGLCTRFAAELVLRTGPEQVTVSIKNGPSKPLFDSGFNMKPFSETVTKGKDLKHIIEEAQKVMKVGGNKEDFSEDILRVEISGPDLYPLTLIDLPGFYHGDTSEQSERGIQIVNRLARQYMAQKNSVILAILSGSYGLANQKVLTEAKDYDTNRERTLGILTKPDTIPTGSDNEYKYLDLIRNKEGANKLKLGWHVLRNRAEHESAVSDEERDSREEQFLSSGVWGAINSGDRGIASLRSKLSKVLVEHIKQNLPRVIDSIEGNITQRRERLAELGIPRSTPEDLRQYLGTIAGKLQTLSMDAVRGTYTDSFFGGLYPDDGQEMFADVRKLRAIIRNLNRAFAAVLATKGETRSIIWKRKGSFDKPKDLESNLPDCLKPLAQLYRVPAPEPIALADLKEELKSLAAFNQGSEFAGSPNDGLATELFKSQSKKWGEIAKQHLRLVIDTAKVFTEKLVEHIIPADTDTQSAILRGIVDPFFDEREVVLDKKLEELLRHYKSGIPQPPDFEFRQMLSFKTKQRTAGLVKDVLDDVSDRLEGKYDMKMINQAILDGPDAMGEFGVERVIDNTVTYYELSLKTFTENVIILAVENCLVSEISGILTPDLVNKMGTDRLEELAAESEAVQGERKHLTRELDSLEQGLRKCQQYKPRASTILPIALQSTAAKSGMNLGQSIRSESWQGFKESSNASAFSFSGNAFKSDNPFKFPVAGTGSPAPDGHLFDDLFQSKKAKTSAGRLFSSTTPNSGVGFGSSKNATTAAINSGDCPDYSHGRRPFTFSDLGATQAKAKSSSIFGNSLSTTHNPKRSGT